MPLMTPDGKPYRTFSEPNPHLIGQENIKTDNLVFHNFKWEPKIADGTPPITGEVATKKKKKKERPEPPEEKDDFLELLKKDVSELKTKPETKPGPKPEPKKEMNSTSTVIVHCLPTVIRERTDSFYGETRKTIQYGDKTSFEAIIIDRTDLEISLWTKQNQNKGSVIYPSVYKTGEKLEDYRWWRVKRSEPIKDGFILFAEITDYQADFS